jgi:hypothetical protein
MKIQTKLYPITWEWLKSYKSYQTFVIIIIILASFFRLQSINFQRELRSDELAYDFAAKNLIKFGVYTYDRYGEMNNGLLPIEPTNSLMPGYPIFLFLVYRLFGQSAIYPQLFNLLFSLVSMILTLKIANYIGVKKLFSLILLVFIAIYPGFILNIDRLLTENFFTFLLLGFVYYFILYLDSENFWHSIVSGLFLTMGIYVRPILFPFMILAIFFCYLYDRKAKKAFYLAVTYLLIFIVSFLPWWIRNFVIFHRLIIFADSEVGPRLWGALPYFIGIFDLKSDNVGEVIRQAFNVDPWLYIRWRILGFLQFEWGDLWDETLVRRTFGDLSILHYFIIVLGFIGIPFSIRRINKFAGFLAVFPLGFSIIYMYYHGLPRYVYPTILILFIFAVLTIQYIWEWFRRKYVSEKLSLFLDKFWLRDISMNFLFHFSAFFCMLVLVSVFIFKYYELREVNQYRVSKFCGQGAQQLVKTPILYQKQISSDEILKYGIASTILISDKGNQNIYQNYVDAPPILRIEKAINTIASNPDQKLVTQVTIKSHQNYLFNYMTVYWLNLDKPIWNESNVIRFPITSMKGEYTVFIDADVNGLVIVPTVFRYGKFSLDDISIKKYTCP